MNEYSDLVQCRYEMELLKGAITIHSLFRFLFYYLLDLIFYLTYIVIYIIIYYILCFNETVS